MAKYEPLQVFLMDRHSDEVTLSFGDLKQILNADLPPSAYHNRWWWANTRNEMRVQAHAWLEGGWTVDTVNFAEKWVRFVRASKPGE